MINLKISDFDYHLPESAIAYYPLVDRSQSKLLHYRSGAVSDHHFFELPELLTSNDVLVFNNTKVVKARLILQNANGARIEIFCIEPYEQSIEQAMQNQEKSVWKCLIGNAKRWKNQEVLQLAFETDGHSITLKCERIGETGSESLVRFSWDRPHITFAMILDVLGKIPLPPYIKRDAEASDEISYQTCYAQVEGSVAAPTAGLHFTPKLLNEMKRKGIEQIELTLHVGAGTFKPVKTEKVAGHEMHAEQYAIEKREIERLFEALKSGKRIIAVGTTSCRTLESLYWLGLKALLGKLLRQEDCYTHQWEPYKVPWQHVETSEAYHALLDFINTQKATRLEGKTGIMLMPGYPYKVIKGLITNFHQPKSTLMLLVAAFVGDDWRKIYEHALANQYRFLSYGDGSLLIP